MLLMLCMRFFALQPGGELYFSDMYTNKPVPDDMKNDKVLWGMHCDFFCFAKSLLQLHVNVSL